MLFTYIIITDPRRRERISRLRSVKFGLDLLFIYISVRYYRYHYRRGDRVNSAAAADSSYARNRHAGASRRRSRSKTLAAAEQLYLYIYRYIHIIYSAGRQCIMLYCVPDFNTVVRFPRE